MQNCHEEISRKAILSLEGGHIKFGLREMEMVQGNWCWQRRISGFRRQSDMLRICKQKRSSSPHA